jgi:hypothetical protein
MKMLQRKSRSSSASHALAKASGHLQGGAQTDQIKIEAQSPQGISKNT